MSLTMDERTQRLVRELHVGGSSAGSTRQRRNLRPPRDPYLEAIDRAHVNGEL